MKWTIKDKILIPSILPKEGSLLIKTLCRDIQKKIILTADEVKKADIETEGAQIKWKIDIDVDIKFTKDELSLLKQAALEIDTKEEVTDHNLSLIERLLA